MSFIFASARSILGAAADALYAVIGAVLFRIVIGSWRAS